MHRKSDTRTSPSETSSLYLWHFCLRSTNADSASICKRLASLSWRAMYNMLITKRANGGVIRI